MIGKHRPGYKAVLMLLAVLLSAAQTLQAQQRELQQDQQQDVSRPVIAESAVPVQAISPRAADGFAGEAFLRKPPGDGPFPAVILIHGGAPRWETGQLRDYAVHVHSSRFLAAGYVVVAMTRRDLDLSLEPMQEQAPVRDAIAVYDYLREQPWVDPDSIVVRGTSVGGFIALEVSAARPVAATLVEEPFSFPFIGIRLGPDQDQNPDLSKLERLQAPILLIRGDQTPNINEFNRDVFIPALRRAGKSLEVQTYPGELHSFAFYDSAERTLHPEVSLQVFNEIDKFFRRHIDTQPQPLDAGLVRQQPVGE